MKRIVLITFFLISLSHLLFAQIDFTELYKASFQSDSISLIEDDYEFQVFFVRTAKKQKWGIYLAEMEEQYNEATEEYKWLIKDKKEIVPAEYDAVFIHQLYYYKFLELKKSGKSTLVYLGEDLNFIDSFAFDEKYLKEFLKRVKSAKLQYEDIWIHKNAEQPLESYILAKKKGKWGQIHFFDNFEVTGFTSLSKEDVPVQRLPFEDYEWSNYKRLVELMRKQHNADLVIMDYNEGDGLNQSRNAKTGKWGWFQAFEKSAEVRIPMVYDSLKLESTNNYFFPVYNQGKVGFYLNYFHFDELAKQSIACEYDDFKMFRKEGVPYLMVAKNGQWALIDWLSGELKTAFSKIEDGEIMQPDYIQATYPE